MQWLRFGACLAVVCAVGCEAKIEGGASFSAQTGGDMMADDDPSSDDDGDGSSGRSAAGGGGSSGGGARPTGSGSGGASAQAGDEAPPEAGTGASASGSGALPPPPPSVPNPDVGGPYDLGELPAGFAIAWPAEPLITQEAEVRTQQEFEQAASTDGTRILVKQDITSANGTVMSGASDLEIQMDPGVQIDATLAIGRGRQRIRLLGGRYRGVMMAPLPETRPLTEDVMIDGVTVQTGAGSAFLLRGRRIAVIRSSAVSTLFSVYADAMSGDPNSDVIVAGNVLQSADEATVRLISVTNSVTVDNHLTNNGKHNYRVHGSSAQSFAARNVFITSGTMLGTMPGDMLVEAWFNDNTFYHTAPDLFHPEVANLMVLHAHGNTAYTDVWGCFYCSTIPAQWDLADNQIMPYQPPP